MSESGTRTSSSSSGLRYKDKVTIVTGGHRGIGKGIVDVFVQNGANVVFCSNDDAGGRSAEASLQALGPGTAEFVFCELTKEADIKNLIDVTVKKYGRIDCLVNNAGTHPPHLPIDDFTAEDFRQLLDVNVVSFFLTSKYALPHLRKSQGNIINISSLTGHIGQQGSVTYGASKGAVTALTKNLAVDEAKRGVRVNGILPGNIWTPLWDEVAHTVPNPSAMLEWGKNCQLMGRFGTTQEIGQACMYLAAEATYSTGMEITVSGGSELDFANKNVLKNGNPVQI